MRWRLTIAFLFALIALPAAAQNFTVVTGTVTDPNGLPYSYASVSAVLVGVNPPVTINGNEISGAAAAQCDATGHFSLSLASNGVVGGQWQFTIGAAVQPPIGTGPQSFSSTSPSAAQRKISRRL